MVEIVVIYGPSREAFYVHKELLCFHSIHCSKILENTSTKQTPQLVEYHSYVPLNFGHFVN